MNTSEGRKRFSIIIFIVLDIIAAGLLAFLIWRRLPHSPVLTEYEQSFVEYSVKISELDSEILKQSQAEGYEATIASLKTRIENETDATEKIDLILSDIAFRSGSGKMTDAERLAELEAIDESNMNDMQKVRFYRLYVFAYVAIGDQEKVKFYEAKINELPSYLIGNGG